MGRRRRGEEPVDFVEGVVSLIGAVAILGVLRLFWQYKTNRAAFEKELTLSVIGLAAIIVVVVAFFSWRRRAHDAKIQRAVDEIKRLKLDDEVKNFIRRFGKDRGTRAEVWTFREYKFRNDRLSDFQSVLSSRGLPLDDETLREVLEKIIHGFAFEETVAGMREAPRPLASLSGSDFERLLARLYEKMGYTVQLNGRTGDQGADLIATRGNERLIIQAKRYTGSVGNAAVQEVVAAKSHYDGNVAIVISTSKFTREAVELAKTNSVQLVGLSDLQRALAEHLHESWN